MTPSLFQGAPDVHPGLAVFRHHSRGSTHPTLSQEQAPSWRQRSQGWDVGPGLESVPDVAPLGQGLAASGAGMGPWSLGGWGSPSQVSPQGLAGRCHPGAREPLSFWTSSWEPEGSSRHLKRPQNWVCHLHWLQQQSLEFRCIDFKLIAMLLNSLSIICSQPYVLTLELAQTCCRTHSKVVVWVLNQLFIFFCWGNFLPSEEVFFTEKSCRCQSKEVTGTQSYTRTLPVRVHPDAERIYNLWRTLALTFPVMVPDLFSCPA